MGTGLGGFAVGMLMEHVMWWTTPGPQVVLAASVPHSSTTGTGPGFVIAAVRLDRVVVVPLALLAVIVARMRVPVRVASSRRLLVVWPAMGVHVVPVVLHDCHAYV